MNRAKGARERIDLLLIQRGIFPTREKARAAIMAGQVAVNGETVDKAGKTVNCHADITIKEKSRFVSRGGLKLERAIVSFDVKLKDRVVLDIGSSTGGFTDCALQYGARRVYAVDVGYGQLDWSLRNDPRVTVLERENIRYLTPATLPEPPDFVTADVSFISLTLIFPCIALLTTPDASGVVLIKPQFEAGRPKVGKKGVVRDPAVHVETIDKVICTVGELGWTVLGLDYSPVKGPRGNIEYLLFFSRKADSARRDISIRDVVEAARLYLH